MPGRQDKNPWTKWYWQDWLADTGVRASSLAAQGLWINMLAIMAKSEKRGYLMINGKQIESKTLAKLLGEPEDLINDLLSELEQNGVFSRDENGTIFCRRMVREAEISEIRAKCGRLGGRKKQNESKIKANGKANLKQNESKMKAKILPEAEAETETEAYSETESYTEAEKEKNNNIALTRKKLRSEPPPVFDFECQQWLNITEELKKAWGETYPSCDIDLELKRMREWIIANPAKGKKRNWRRFITNWLARTQDRGGTKGVNIDSQRRLEAIKRALGDEK